MQSTAGRTPVEFGFDRLLLLRNPQDFTIAAGCAAVRYIDAPVRRNDNSGRLKQVCCYRCPYAVRRYVDQRPRATEENGRRRKLKHVNASIRSKRKVCYRLESVEINGRSLPRYHAVYGRTTRKESTPVSVLTYNAPSGPRFTLVGTASD